ncbi:MAG: hypothetical protein H7Z16_05525 [Pyrinomonadaceae bacterium]|nr:hypothetical protein [Pyrinomonadaceae bacterium]
MKSKITASLIFVGGLLVGALSTFMILGQVSHLQYRDYFMMTAREQTFIAWELRANRQRELQNRVEANLPAIVRAIQNDGKLQSASDSQSVLKGIRDFYEMNSLPIPSEISVILSGVPPSH